MYLAVVLVLNFRCVALLWVLLNTVLIVQVSDTTGDAICTIAGNQKFCTDLNVGKLIREGVSLRLLVQIFSRPNNKQICLIRVQVNTDMEFWQILFACQP